MLCATPSLGAPDRLLAEQVVRGIGDFLWVRDETAMDAVTAVSGSGPAYLFYFLEHLQAAAEQLGFGPAEAKRLALLTAQGAIQQAIVSDENLGVLRERVTSKGGTTAAALNVLAERNVGQSIVEAVKAAYMRAQQLAAEAASDEKTV